MNKEKISKSRKIRKSRRIRIIKIIIFVVAGAGLLFMLYPSIVNAIVGVKQADVLSEWETRQENLSGEEINQTGSVESTETTAEGTTPGEDENSAGAIGQSGSSNVNSIGIGKETLDYEVLTAEDFFPLKMSIPRIDLEQVSYEGADTQTLKQGPGHIA